MATMYRLEPDTYYNPDGAYVNCVSMTQRAELHKRLKDANLRRSLRSLGDDIGISHTAVSDFLREPDKADDRTVGLIQEWADGGRDGGNGTTAEQELAKQIERVQAVEMDETVRAWQLAEIGAAWRALALAREAAAAEARARAATSEAAAADGRARAISTAEQAALTRFRPSEADEAVVGTATGQRRRQQQEQRQTPAAPTKKRA